MYNEMKLKNLLKQSFFDQHKVIVKSLVDFTSIKNRTVFVFKVFWHLKIKLWNISEPLKEMVTFMEISQWMWYSNRKKLWTISTNGEKEMHKLFLRQFTLHQKIVKAQFISSFVQQLAMKQNLICEKEWFVYSHLSFYYLCLSVIFELYYWRMILVLNVSQVF